MITDADPGVRARAHKARLKIDSQLDENSSALISEAISTDISANSPLVQISDSLSKANDPRELATLILQCSQINASDEDKITLIKPYLKHQNGRVRANAVESLSILYPDSRRISFSIF